MTSVPSISALPAWQPILRDDLAEQALEAVQAIAGDLRRFAADPHPSATWWDLEPGYELSLASGWAGLALFFGELDRVQPGRGHGDLALDLLDRAIALVGEQDVVPGLYGGFPGVAWAMEYLEGRFCESEEEEDPGEEAAAALAGQLGRSPWTGDYELINGLAGWGAYALERWPRPLAPECLAGVVARLAETAEVRLDGIAWRTPPERIAPEMRAAFPEGSFNLGVSHGVPGVIPVLAGACAAGIAGARPLLDGAVSWLLARRLPPGAGSVFPTQVTPEGEAAEPSGLAWCYGDPGIACALLAAARSVGGAYWESEALEVARAAAARRSANEEPAGAGLCHGAAGLGHLFNRLHQETGDPAFADAARHWFGRTLAMRRPGEGFGGFQCWMKGPGEVLGWWNEPGFLMGSAGIGLALLAAVAPGEPGWDRVLLISPPRPATARNARQR